MKKGLRRLCACVFCLLVMGCLTSVPGRAAASGVYFTAANDQLMDLSADTMPFYSNGVLYVSSRLFEGGELGVSYARHTGLGLATLYSSTLDLRFDLAGQVVYDKQYNLYSGYAIERGGVVFFPLNTVCRYFGLTWTQTDTDTAPLIRVKSSSVVLSDDDFIYAAARLMSSRYSEYERSLGGRPAADPDPPVSPGSPAQAVEGQKVYLLFDGSAAREILPVLEDVQATFLLTEEDLADGDLLRSVVAGGHMPVLRVAGEIREDVGEEVRRGQDALWQAACARLDLVWYDGEEDLTELFADMGCVQVRAGLEQAGASAPAALRAVGKYREDVAVYLGGVESLDALPELLSGLKEGRYHISAWRLTA